MASAALIGQYLALVLVEPLRFSCDDCVLRKQSQFYRDVCREKLIVQSHYRPRYFCPHMRGSVTDGPQRVVLPGPACDLLLYDHILGCIRRRYHGTSIHYVKSRTPTSGYMIVAVAGCPNLLVEEPTSHLDYYVHWGWDSVGAPSRR